MEYELIAVSFGLHDCFGFFGLITFKVENNLYLPASYLQKSLFRDHPLLAAFCLFLEVIDSIVILAPGTVVMDKIVGWTYLSS